MNIVLTGVESNNKGAELMLYAILQEIGKKWPDAHVYIEPENNRQGLEYIKTHVTLKYWPYARFIQKTHLKGIFCKLHLPLKMLRDTCAVKADYLFDGSGFCFSDQCGMWGRKADWWESLLKKQYTRNAKIIFLPQAFGPFEKEETKAVMRVLNKYATCIMPREAISFDYLEKSGLVDMHKVKTYTDFTSLVEGVFPEQYTYLKNGICIIPNMKMIEKGSISMNDYMKLLTAIIKEGKDCGYPVYLLNHEGQKDERLARECKEMLNGGVEVVSGINALEVKGMIASAYMVVTSRFHGLASALNSCVPATATSWSHKYSELYKDYNLDDYVLPLENIECALSKIKEVLDVKNNKKLRDHLVKKHADIQSETHKMWDYIWSL